MSRRAELLRLLAKNPDGLTDAELARLTGASHQTVNRTCRQLAAEQLIHRDDLGRPIMNHGTDAQPPTRPITIGPGTPHREEWFWESNVQGQVVRHLSALARLLRETGFELCIRPLVTFVDQVTTRGRTVAVPTSLPRLPVERALATVVLPIHLNWSAQGRRFDLADRPQRARVYEIVLREGGPDDILTYVDGALLVDLWADLVLPRDVRGAWDPVIQGAVRVAA